MRATSAIDIALVGVPATETRPLGQLEVLGRRLERVGGDLEQLRAHPVRRLGRRRR